MNSSGATFAQGDLLSDRTMMTASLSKMMPIHLVAFPQDGGAGSGAYFGFDIDSAANFATFNCDRQHNVYWTVNEASPECGTKPSKEQIRSIRYAHLDLDPPKDGSPFDKGAALIAIQQDWPTFVVDSGNGWHVYWRLADPIDATPDNVAAIEGVNRAIIHRHNGDGSTWNVDRILRLPGTINWPSEKKRAAGRIPQRVILL